MATGRVFGTGETALSAPTYALQANARFAPSRDTDPAIIDSGLWTHTTALAGTGEINLFKLPPGRVKVFVDTSRITTSQYEATSDLDIGHRAYTEPDGTAQGQVYTTFATALDVGGGAIDAAPLAPTAGIREFNSRDGVVIFARIFTADIEDADTLRVWFHYTKAP